MLLPPHTLPLLHCRVPLTGDTSTNFSNTSPSHGMQFMNCSNLAPPWGSQVLSANLLQRGLLSPQSHSSLQELAPAQGLHGITASFRHPPALARGPPWAAGGDLLHCGPPWAAKGQPASPWSGPWAVGNLCSGAWNASSPPSILTTVSAELFLSHILTPLSYCMIFSPS